MPDSRTARGKVQTVSWTGWRYLRGTLTQRPAPGLTQEAAVIVFCVDGWIVAALDERATPRGEWEAEADWGNGLHVPVCGYWRNELFGLVTPLARWAR